MTDTFSVLPFIKVKLIYPIIEEDIDIICKIILFNNIFDERPLIKINNGFCLSRPKRVLEYIKNEENIINFLQIKHSELHFDPEIEGSDIYKLIKLINITICQIKNINFDNNFKNIIHVKLYRKPLQKNNLNKVLENTIESFKNYDIILEKDNYKITKPMEVDFVIEEDDIIKYIQFEGSDKVIISKEQEEFINKLIAILYYENYYFQKKSFK